MKKRLSLKMGLRGQLVFLFLLVSLIPLLVASLLARGFGVRALENTIGESLARFARSKLDQADRIISIRLTAIRDEIDVIRDTVALTNDGVNGESQRIRVSNRLEDSVERFEDHAGLGSDVIITNLNRQIIGSTNSSLHLQTVDSDWWNRCFNNGLGYDLINNLEYDAKNRSHFLWIALPVRDVARQRVVGILRIRMIFPELLDLVGLSHEQEDVMQEIEASIITKYGRVIVSSAEKKYKFMEHIEMTDGAMKAIVSATANGEHDGYEMESEGDAYGDKRVYGWARTRQWEDEPWNDDQNFSNWVVLVSQPESLAFQEINMLTKRILSFTLIFCVIVIPIAWIVSQRIVTPIMRIASASRAIGEGDFDQEIAVTSGNEVGILAEEFNSMRNGLKFAIDKVTKEEKKMTAIVNSLAEGLILVDGNHQVLHINPAAEYLLNIEASQIGKDFTQIIQDAQLTGALSESQHQISLNQTVNSEVVLNQGEETSVLRVVASPFLDEEGLALGTVYVFDDITREKEIDRMKSDFVSLVSHELRTPLTSIIGFVSLILDGKIGPINENQKRSLVRVQHQSERLASLINDLLDISRIESGRIQMKEEEISPSAIAEQRIEEIRPQADAKSLQLELIVAESLPTIVGDGERIGQVFTNLIGNAIKFTPENGTVTVRISGEGEIVDSFDGSIHVEVIDTGEGVPVEERQRVFDRYHQLSNIHTRREGGSGLGLSIVKSIVESHGGTVWVDGGSEGQGSNFQFKLPLEHAREINV